MFYLDIDIDKRTHIAIKHTPVFKSVMTRNLPSSHND